MVMCLNLLGKCKYGHSQAAGTFLLLHSVRYSGTKQRAYLSYLSPRLLTRSVVSGGRTNHLIKNTSGREQRERKREKKKKKKKPPATCFYLKQSVWWWGEGNVPLPGWSALPTEHIISCFPSVSESPRYLPWRATDCSTQSCQEGLATAQKARHKDAERLPDENERGMNWICTLSQKRVFIKCMTHFQSGVFEVRVWQTHPAPNQSEYRANRVCSVSTSFHTGMKPSCILH